ncbi:MAG: rod shape-determining protein MreC [Saprospiraceae bacterium]|nr:rod shape-determining protein MreC [Saprospiraceae bacterium]
MQNLLRFIFRYSHFFTFVILEAICIYFLVSYNTSQKEIFIYSSNLVTGKIYNTVDEIRDYAQLERVNDSIIRENARLKAALLTLSADSTLPDLSITNYKVIPSRVINNNILGRNNMMTIDQGSDAGIQPSMGLIEDGGIVGIVKDVSQNYATAYSILNASLMISAKIDRNDHFGSLIWPAEDIRYMELTSVPKHAEVRLGDTVTTTAYSAVFPPDIPIGIIEEVDLEPGRSDFSIRVKLFNDLSRIDVVYAVRAETTPERTEIENRMEDE